VSTSAFAVDLYCGVGGLTHGLKKAGIRVVAGVDVDPICEFPFEYNNAARFVLQDVATISADDLEKLFPPNGHRVLTGCAPCQPFSRYARGNRVMDHKRWGLLAHFARLVEAVRPEIVSMENVPELRLEEIFGDFVSRLKGCGYTVQFQNVFCPDYGLPQQRTRLVLLASRSGPMEFPSPTHPPENHRTVRQAISGLAPVRAGGQSRKDALHRASRLTEINLMRIKQSRPGGCWREWPPKLLAKCHVRKSGGTYPSVYGRMEWDRPSPTITTQFFGYGNGRFGHPSQDRAISLREGALLQSFPIDYQFSSPSCTLSFATLGRLIGNAVPVRLGEVIGKAIMEHLERAH
jgi:DNA (cytosine-5)-methyltransferase 1